jgi:hypothetical protein
MKEMVTNKKGSVTDYPLIIVFLFGTSLVLLTATYLMTNIKAGFAGAGIGVEIFNAWEGTLTTFDLSLAFIMLGMMGGTVIAAAYIDTSPMWFFFSALLLTITILVSATISNVFKAIQVQDGFITASTNFPVMIWIMTNLPLLLTGGALVTLVVLYSKMRAPL